MMEVTLQQDDWLFLLTKGFIHELLQRTLTSSSVIITEKFFTFLKLLLTSGLCEVGGQMSELSAFFMSKNWRYLTTN